MTEDQNSKEEKSPETETSEQVKLLQTGDDSLKTTDVAISRCEKIISHHRGASNLLIISIVAVIIVVALYFFGKSGYENIQLGDTITRYSLIIDTQQKILDSAYTLNPQLPKVRISPTGGSVHDNDTLLQDAANGEKYFDYGVIVVAIITISVLTGIYRFHLKEISKAEQNLIAFHRIRIAAYNYNKGGYDELIRTTLVKDAFYYVTKEDGSFLPRKKKIESPLPGYPTADIATTLINKILESVDVVLKSDKKG